MERNKNVKTSAHESRAALTLPYLDEDPDIDLTLPEPDEKASDVSKVQTRTDKLAAGTRRNSKPRNSV